MISFTKAFISTILFIGGSFFIPGQAGAGDTSVQAPFNTGEIIERVSHHPRVEGDRIVIQDRAYEAEFKEGKAVIKAREGKPGAEDVVIPVSGRPEVRDGRVVYSSWEGEVEFEGYGRGLKYQEHGWMIRDSLTGRNTGNVAKRKFDSSKTGQREGGSSSQNLTGEFLLDTAFVYIPEPWNQMNCGVGSDGSDYLVAWVDFRQGPSYIYGARVSSSGNVIDLAGFTIATLEVDYDSPPCVSFDGTNYLVVWSTGDVYGSRVSRNGVVLDPNGFVISSAPFWQGFPKVSFNGLIYFVVWEDYRFGPYTSDIFGARVTTNGAVLDSNGIAICTAVDYQWDPAVAFDGSNFLVVWSDARSQVDFDLYGARVSTGGVVLDTAGIAISTKTSWEEYPVLAFDGTNYFVVWARGNLYGTRVSPSGTVLDTAGIRISTNSGGQSSMLFDGNNYFIVWTTQEAVMGARVTPSGVVIDPNGITIDTVGSSNYAPSVTYNGTNYLVAWMYPDPGPYGSYWNIYGARVSPAGVVLDPNRKLLTTIGNPQTNPSIAFDGSNYLVVWEDVRRGINYDIYGVRVSPYGVILDPGGISISAASGAQIAPSVGFDGTNYLAVWQETRGGTYDIYGARISPSGVVLDTAGFVISAATGDQGSPSIAFDGTNDLVVWVDTRRSSNDIYGARVSPGGIILDPNGIAICTNAYAKQAPSSAFDGTNYLVVWEEYWTDWPRGTTYSSVHGARVNRGGVVLDTSRLNISSDAIGHATPSASFDGSNFFVVWSADHGGSSSYDIYGARVNGNGVVLDTNGLAISTSPNAQGLPTVAYDGAYNLVVWQDYRNGSRDIYGAKVDTGGAVVDSFAVSLQLGDQLNPTIAHGPGDQVLVAYSGYTDSINNLPVKTTRIWGKFYPGPLGVEKQDGIGGLGSRPSLRVYPNPFREKAWVSANVPGRLKVYDALGRLVREFPKETAKPGPLVWDGRDERGRKLPGGVYFLRFEHGTGCETRKAVLIR